MWAVIGQLLVCTIIGQLKEKHITQYPHLTSSVSSFDARIVNISDISL